MSCRGMAVMAWVVVLGCVAGGGAVAAEARGPGLLGFRGEDLRGVRERYRAGEAGVVEVVKRGVAARAEGSMGVRPRSVMEKEFVGPSGDKHDYVSLSPYWWRDESKADGLPYVRRDGEFNPERAKYDEGAFTEVTEAVLALGLGYYFTGEKKYAEHARELTRVWFLSPETRMNPNCEFAQFVPGRPGTRASGVIEVRKTVFVLDGIRLIEGAGVWTAEDEAGMRAWVRGLLDYLLTSKQGMAEAKSPNNHGTWYGVQVAAYAVWLGEEERARELLVKYVRDRVRDQFDVEGKQPHELERTNGLHYCRFNLLAHEDAAVLGERVGLDLWNYEVEGRSMRKGLEWLLPYATGEKKWAYQQISEVKKRETAVVYRRAGNAYGEKRYEEAVGKISPEEGVGDIGEVVYPRK